MSEATTLSLLVAHDLGRVIGRDGDLPWRLPNDLKQFKQRSLGKTVLMGRRTWDSLPRKPLPGRDNWVLSRDPAFVAEGARSFQSLEQALAAHAGGELLVIGGGELYRLALPRAQRIYLTLVQTQVNGDTWFPDYDPADFQEIERLDHPADAQHACAYSFLTLERRHPKART
jgi:dihydrofolate reductase